MRYARLGLILGALILPFAASAQTYVVDLAWQPPAASANTPAVTAYVVKKGTATLTTTAATARSFTDTEVSSGQQPCYTVTARNSIGDGPASSEICVTIPSPVPPTPQNPPGAPTNVTATVREVTTTPPPTGTADLWECDLNTPACRCADEANPPFTSGGNCKFTFGGGPDGTTSFQSDAGGTFLQFDIPDQDERGFFVIPKVNYPRNGFWLSWELRFPTTTCFNSTDSADYKLAIIEDTPRMLISQHARGGACSKTGTLDIGEGGGPNRWIPTTAGNNAISANGEWHKIDVFYNASNRQYEVWLNGTQVLTRRTMQSTSGDKTDRQIKFGAYKNERSANFRAQIRNIRISTARIP